MPDKKKKKATKLYNLDVSYEFTVANLGARDAAIFAAVGRPSEESGAGLGARDHGWTRLGAASVGAAVARLLAEGLVDEAHVSEIAWAKRREDDLDA